MTPFVVAIPARRGSTRLPDKPLRLLAGRPLIVHVIERARAATATEVVVATDDAEIADLARVAGAQASITRADHSSGTDRLAEVALQRAWADDTIVVNLQGDEPLAPPAGIRAVAQLLIDNPDCPMATLAAPVESVGQYFDPNCVKLVLGQGGRALYFSRAPIPWPRDAFAQQRDRLPTGGPWLRHIGIYAYRAGFLRRFTALPPTPLEQIEALEQLRALEHGVAIAVATTPAPFPAGVDTAHDLARVEAILALERNR
jgi:3-deoxy-manno-octulosonate cytidylyltransferase (CMP-KDO synthetase)